MNSDSVHTMSDGFKKVIEDMRHQGMTWSEVCDWITGQVGYDTRLVEWARRVYNDTEVVG